MLELFEDRPSFWILQSVIEKLSADWFIAWHDNDEEDNNLTIAIDGAIEDVRELQNLEP